jgi:hypothetical protein
MDQSEYAPPHQAVREAVAEQVDVDKVPAQFPDNAGQSSERRAAEVGYESVIQLWVYEGQMIWSRFNAMLLANSIILAGIGFTADSLSRTRTFLSFALPCFGIVLCLLWWALLARGYDYYAYWIHCAREIEERYLAPSVRTVSRGANFADGRPVRLMISGGKNHRLSWLSRTLRVRYASYLVILVFAVLYVLNLGYVTLH